MKKQNRAAGLMDVGDLFRSANDRVSRFSEAQVHLYRSDPSLYDYFHVLDANMLYGQNGERGTQSSINPLALWSYRAADRASRISRQPKIRADVLYCPTPYYGRKTEVRFLMQTLLGLGQTGAEVVCLLSVHAPFLKELEELLESAGCSKRIRFIDPAISAGFIEGRMREVGAKLRGRAAYSKTVEMLEPYGLSPTRSALADFQRSAQFVEAWDRLAPSIEFDAVVARCHWYDMCSSVCRTGLERGKPVITFQQGVIDYTMDVPIVASKYVAFGRSSARVLAELSRRFFSAVGTPVPPVDFVPAGSLFDHLLKLPDQYSLQTVLLIDSHEVEGDPFGTRAEVCSILQLAENLLRNQPSMRRLVIRPHPHWNNHDLSACMRLAREHRDKCELSHPVWPLEDDLRRASVVVGISSGVLTVASASGLPAVFLRTEGGFRIQDLECFSPEQTLLPDETFRHISTLLTDHDAYAEAREVAMRNAQNYYEKGANAVLDGTFFTKLLETPMKALEDDRDEDCIC